MNPQIAVQDDLTLSIGPQIIGRLEADQALDLAAELARRAFRRIASEEGADVIFQDVASEQPAT